MFKPNCITRRDCNGASCPNLHLEFCFGGLGGRVYDGYDCDYYDNDYYYLTTTILRTTYHSLLITRYFLLTKYYILFAAY